MLVLGLIVIIFLTVSGLIFIFQRYLESRLISTLFMLLGTAIAVIGLITAAVFEHFGYHLLSDWFEYIVLIPGIILMLVGFFYYPIP
ncbi:MAG: hypothetical protein A2W27_11995 [Deltaproteobacteria bacterium RBG_16_44_11]|nr:MAG: hypothetical protein A2W27_11995 [Deltaproteobacteria bacterium RBG_16_44_11]